MFPSSSYNEQASLGILQHLDTNALQSLLNDDAKLTQLIKDDQQVKNRDVDREALIAQNKSAAEYNLLKEPKLTQAKQQLASAYNKAIEMQKTLEANKQGLDACGMQNSIDTVLALLQTEAAKSEEMSEKTATRFIEGKMDLDEFIELYTEQRTVVHMRRVKAEKMAEIIRQRAGMPYGAFAPYPGQMWSSNSIH